MKKKIILMLILIFTLLAIYFAYIKITDKNKIDNENIYLPQNYTLNSYTIAEISTTSCQKKTDCQTPAEYLMRSSCPYTSLCINKKCSVVCPDYKTESSISR